MHEDIFNNNLSFLCALRVLCGDIKNRMKINAVKCSSRKLFGSLIPDAGAKNTAGQAKR